MAQYSSNVRMLYGTPMLRVAPLEKNRRDRVERIVGAARAGGRTQLTRAEAKEILDSYAIEVADMPVCLNIAEGGERRVASAGALELLLESIPILDR
jgi:acyl-CoA synthetase (NDP forming)